MPPNKSNVISPQWPGMAEFGAVALGTEGKLGAVSKPEIFFGNIASSNMLEMLSWIK